MPITLMGGGNKKIISNFKVTRPMSLMRNAKNFETIQAGVYRIILQKKGGHLILWFEKLDKEFKFKVPARLNLGENFTLKAKDSGQPYTLTVYKKQKKRKVKDYVEKVETVCKKNKAMKFSEECHPKLEWVPIEYRKLATKKADLYCYLRPEKPLDSGKRQDKVTVSVYSSYANIDLVDPRKSEIVASAQYYQEETQRKLWKKGDCR